MEAFFTYLMAGGAIIVFAALGIILPLIMMEGKPKTDDWSKDQFVDGDPHLSEVRGNRAKGEIDDAV